MSPGDALLLKAKAHAIFVGLECVPKRGFSRQKALADSFGRLPGLLDGVGMKAHERRLVHHDGARLGKAPS